MKVSVRLFSDILLDVDIQVWSVEVVEWNGDF